MEGSGREHRNFPGILPHAYRDAERGNGNGSNEELVELGHVGKCEVEPRFLAARFEAENGTGRVIVFRFLRKSEQLIFKGKAPFIFQLRTETICAASRRRAEEGNDEEGKEEEDSVGEGGDERGGIGGDLFWAGTEVDKEGDEDELYEDEVLEAPAGREAGRADGLDAEGGGGEVTGGRVASSDFTGGVDPHARRTSRGRAREARGGSRRRGEVRTRSGGGVVKAEETKAGAWWGRQRRRSPPMAAASSVCLSLAETTRTTRTFEARGQVSLEPLELIAKDRLSQCEGVHAATSGNSRTADPDIGREDRHRRPKRVLIGDELQLGSKHECTPRMEGRGFDLTGLDGAWDTGREVWSIEDRKTGLRHLRKAYTGARRGETALNDMGAENAVNGGDDAEVVGERKRKTINHRFVWSKQSRNFARVCGVSNELAKFSTLFFALFSAKRRQEIPSPGAGQSYRRVISAATGYRATDHQSKSYCTTATEEVKRCIVLASAGVTGSGPEQMPSTHQIRQPKSGLCGFPDGWTALWCSSRGRKRHQPCPQWGRVGAWGVGAGALALPLPLAGAANSGSPTLSIHEGNSLLTEAGISELMPVGANAGGSAETEGSVACEALGIAVVFPIPVTVLVLDVRSKPRTGWAVWANVRSTGRTFKRCCPNQMPSLCRVPLFWESRPRLSRKMICVWGWKVGEAGSLPSTSTGMILDAEEDEEEELEVVLTISSCLWSYPITMRTETGQKKHVRNWPKSGNSDRTSNRMCRGPGVCIARSCQAGFADGAGCVALNLTAASQLPILPIFHPDREIWVLVRTGGPCAGQQLDVSFAVTAGIFGSLGVAFRLLTAKRSCAGTIPFGKLSSEFAEPLRK
ncbi:hypothetical protein FB451DRAFT_1162404 [Mycena latifolia]|nr:hypothetical protein FB451DRAFT_1162404 [Mycena latifolia]